MFYTGYRSANSTPSALPLQTAACLQPPPPLPSPRLVNGEGDRLSGLVVDVFAGVVGVSSSAVWVEAFRPEIEAALGEVFGTDASEIIWRRSDGRLQQDGWKGNNQSSPVAAVEEATGADGDAARGAGSSEEVGAAGGGKAGEKRLRSDAPSTVVREHGLEFEVRPQFGQKTGEKKTANVDTDGVCSRVDWNSQSRIQVLRYCC